MYERFTDRARKVMELANLETQRLNHEYIGTEHILLGLVKEGSGIAATILQGLGVDTRTIRLEIEKNVSPGPEMVMMGRLPQTPRSKNVIEYAREESKRLNLTYVGTEHLLLGLMRDGEGLAAQVLIRCGLSLEVVRDIVMQFLGHSEDSDAQVLSGAKIYRIRIELHKVLLQFDEAINVLDTAVFEAAHYDGIGSLDAQRDRAMSANFQLPIKSKRDAVMEIRNSFAQMLGFRAREAHDTTPRDYRATPLGYLIRVVQ